MNRSRLLPAALVGLLALTGCSSDPTSASDPQPVSWRLSYDAGAPVRLATRVGSSVLDGTTLLYAYTDRRSGNQNQLGSTDVTTGKRTEVARGSFPGGSITGVVRTGDEIVYIEESARGRSTPGAARWRVIALDHAGRHQVIATSGDRRVAMTPDLTTLDGAAEWTVYPRLNAFTWRPGQHAARPETARPGDAHECTPRASRPELVVSCVSRNGWTAWTERDDPAVGGAESDDPAHLFLAGPSGDKRLIADLEASTAAPEIFGGYLLWDRGDGIEVTSLEHATATAEIARSTFRFLTSSNGQSAAVITESERATTVQVLDSDTLHLTSQ